jgi:hypothetical protein
MTSAARKITDTQTLGKYVECHIFIVSNLWQGLQRLTGIKLYNSPAPSVYLILWYCCNCRELLPACCDKTFFFMFPFGREHYSDDSCNMFATVTTIGNQAWLRCCLHESGLTFNPEWTHSILMTNPIKRQFFSMSRFFQCHFSFAMKSVQNLKSFLRSSQNYFVLALFSSS